MNWTAVLVFWLALGSISLWFAGLILPGVWLMEKLEKEEALVAWVIGYLLVTCSTVIGLSS